MYPTAVTTIHVRGLYSAEVTDDETGETRKVWLFTEGSGPLDIEETLTYFAHRGETVEDIRDPKGRSIWEA